MNGWWVHDYYNAWGATFVLSWIFWVILSITLHELAHGWAALWQGDDTPRRLQRMTANPVVHMGVTSLIILAIVGIAWGQMPTDPSRYRWRRKGRIVVAAAGPAMNIVLAVGALTAFAIWEGFGANGRQYDYDVGLFFFVGGWLNLALAAFNLLPIPPLDGSQILCGMSLRLYQLYHHPNAQMFGLFAILALFLSGLGGLVFFVLSFVVSGIYIGLAGMLLTGQPFDPPIFY